MFRRRKCLETCASYNAGALTRYELLRKVVRRIPHGRVATYGQVAELAGLEGHARQVGYALHTLPARSDVPWHRVVNARGEISPRSAGDSHELQRLLLEEEGVEISPGGKIDLTRFRWKKKAERRVILRRSEP